MDSTPAPGPASEPFTTWRATAHGLDADTVRLAGPDEHRALWLWLAAAGNISIRIDLKRPQEYERDRKGLRRLAALATQAAQEIERLQRDDGEAGTE